MLLITACGSDRLPNVPDKDMPAMAKWPGISPELVTYYERRGFHTLPIAVLTGQLGR
jgi:hypothetical protein